MRTFDGDVVHRQSWARPDLDDHRNVGEQADGHRIGEFDRQIGVQREHDLLIPHRPELEALLVDEQFGEPEVALPRPDSAADAVGTVRRHRGQDHPRKLPVEPADQARKRIGGKRIENRDRERAGPQFGDVVHDGPRPLDVREHLARRMRERRARRGDPQLPSPAIEQFDTQIAFESADRLRQRRLRDEQRPRSLGDAAVIGHGDQVFGVPDVHHQSLATTRSGTRAWAPHPAAPPALSTSMWVSYLVLPTIRRGKTCHNSSMNRRFVMPKCTRIFSSVAPPNGTCEQGARRVAGGHAYSEGNLATGYFVPPTILELPSQARDAWREELFGPVLAVRRARTVDAAFGLASDSEFGLSAAIFTQDLTHTLDAIDDIDVGILHIDSNPPARTPTTLSAARRRADTLHAVTSIGSLAVHVVEHANPRIAVLQGHIPDRSS
ncbi:Aldehyde dehydrogenase [Rhodococcus wratislaviensis]|uniref:Aldehyde dehydrogenase n=1 Tax=Rhodococcus wratislaviensis TaxID=44752 RepID=A0A402C5H1_RHOWR|nr:Aldehyde dehydrogenase [Rhodococcus wratislaviensis]